MGSLGSGLPLGEAGHLVVEGVHALLEGSSVGRDLGVPGAKAPLEPGRRVRDEDGERGPGREHRTDDRDGGYGVHGVVDCGMARRAPARRSRAFRVLAGMGLSIRLAAVRGSSGRVLALSAFIWRPERFDRYIPSPFDRLMLPDRCVSSDSRRAQDSGNRGHARCATWRGPMARREGAGSGSMRSPGRTPDPSRGARGRRSRPSGSRSDPSERGTRSPPASRRGGAAPRRGPTVGRTAARGAARVGGCDAAKWGSAGTGDSGSGSARCV